MRHPSPWIPGRCEVTAITENEPKHWHDANGKHRMMDPRRSIDSYPERWWDADERAYVTHLQTHEGEHTDPQRKEGDSPTVQGLFDLLEARERECTTIRELISATRLNEESKQALIRLHDKYGK